MILRIAAKVTLFNDLFDFLMFGDVGLLSALKNAWCSHDLDPVASGKCHHRIRRDGLIMLGAFKKPYKQYITDFSNWQKSLTKRSAFRGVSAQSHCKSINVEKYLT
jgi:hypothetical protein